MEKRLFREKSIDRVSSPEQLDGYIRVVNPGVWLILGAILVFLASVILWSVTGTLDVTVGTKGYSDGTFVYCYLDETEIGSVRPGMDAYVGNAQGRVDVVAEIPDAYKDIAKFLGGEGMAHALYAVEGDWRYKVVLEGVKAKEGICDVTIVTDRVNPISYLLDQS